MIEKAKVWSESTQPGEARTVHVRIEPGATEEQIREAFRIAADATVKMVPRVTWAWHPQDHDAARRLVAE